MKIYLFLSRSISSFRKKKCPVVKHLTKVHQIITAGCAFLKKEECYCTKSWTMSLDSTRRHLNPPWSIMQHELFFPLRGVLLCPSNRKGVIAFACNDDFGKTQTMEPFSQRL